MPPSILSPPTARSRQLVPVISAVDPTKAPAFGMPGARTTDLTLEPYGSTVDWKSLVPAGTYPRCGQRLFNGALLVLVLLPALLVGVTIGLANWIAFRDHRKIFFVQPRMGWRRTVFPLIKFRTMREASQSHFEAWGEGDALRVTRLGRFLRNTHLDELPQVLNVLRGEMNFIGPRPEMLEIENWASEHIPGFSKRLAIKPGLTGWAQITQGYTGQDVPAYAEKLRINELYLQRLSFTLDIEILLRTGAWMLRGRGWNWNKARRSQLTATEGPAQKTGTLQIDLQSRDCREDFHV